MNERITNTEVKDFLKDFALYSETEILEEGKEKNEVIAIAKTKDIDLLNNRDLAGFKTIYTFADLANKNRARLPKKALLKALPTMIGKPVDIDHNRRYVVGHYIDYRYKQKEDMVIAYGVFYKSNFGEEWEKVKQLFKSKKLSTSYEIWCPNDKRRMLNDGTYELLQQEIAGGALLIKEDPAFEEALVLELAKKTEAMEAELVYAQYKEDELIFGEEPTSTAVETTTNTDDVIPVISSDIPQSEVVNNKIKCSNCGKEFDPPLVPTNEIKCKNCFAILDKAGNLIYPPQIIDFKVLCPNCRMNNWLMISKKEDTSHLKCLSCSKEYQISFDKRNLTPLIEKIDFVYEGRVLCFQCGSQIEFNGISRVKTKTLKCHKCGLEFSYNIDKELYKKITKIEEIQIDKNQKSSEEGGIEMKADDTIKASETKVEAPKVEEVISEAPQEVKVDETQAKEQPEAEVVAQEAPQAEEKHVEARFEYEIIDTEELEVSQTFNCSCVECGYKIVSDKHCSALKCPKCGGQMRREERPGSGKPEENAEKLTYKEKQTLSDSLFAVVVTVKNKRTGGTRKVRMFPIKDEAHVRNALARLAQEAPQKTLKKLGVSVEKVRAKILRRARTLKMTELVNRYKAGVKKVAQKYKDTKKQMKKMKEEMTEECAFYKTNAGEINKRREELGTFANTLTDKDIMIDEKYLEAKITKENSTIVKASKVGEKSKNDAYYKKLRTEIDNEAFGNN